MRQHGNVTARQLRDIGLDKDVLERWPRPPHVTVTQGDPRPPGIIVHRAKLPRADRTRERGIPTTTAARALLDAAPAHRRRAGAGDRRRPAVRRRHPRAAAPLGLGAGLSRLGVAHGLPEPAINVRLGPYEVDALFAREKVIVELDGWEFHQSKRSFERDRDRDADTAAWGFVTVRLTWERHRAAPAREAARLRATLSRR